MLTKLILFISLVAGLPADVLFQSEESRNPEGSAIVNRISMISDRNHDVWLMNQKHDVWERLAIVVDHTTKTARFYQLEPGSLGPATSDQSDVMSWLALQKQREFRVECALCHANGPRAVRPLKSLDVRAWMRVALWNLRIKTYPRLHQEAAETSFARLEPFEFANEFAREPLRVATCVFCHRDDRRGTLLRQNALAIKSMVESRNMPPWGIPLPVSQREELDRFLEGI